MLKNKSVRISLKRIIQGLPLVAVIGASMIVKEQIFQQLLMLVIFIWLQVFFITEVIIPI
jgi:hypothetical protein